MKNKILFKNSLLLIALLAIIGIILYVLIIFSFDFDKLTFDVKYCLIAPIFFIAILASGLYSIDYFKTTFFYNLSFGLTRKENMNSYFKTILLVLLMLLIFSFVYLISIFIYLFCKGVSFTACFELIVELIKIEMLFDVISYYIFCNATIAFISNILDKIIKGKEIIIIISYVLIISVLFILNLIYNILNGKIIFNLLFIILGIVLFLINYKVTLKKNY